MIVSIDENGLFTVKAENAAEAVELWNFSLGFRVDGANNDLSRTVARGPLYTPDGLGVPGEEEK